jgi:hypothetical protein
MTKLRAFAIHLTVSITIFLIFLGILFFVWYPAPYFAIDGGWKVPSILAGAHLALAGANPPARRPQAASGCHRSFPVSGWSAGVAGGGRPAVGGTATVRGATSHALCDERRADRD